MNKLIILLATLCLSMNLSGQVHFGVKTFIGSDLSSSLTKNYADVSARKVYQYEYLNSQPRKGVGLSLYAQNDILFFNSDALYTTSGRQFNLISTSIQKTQLDPSIQLQTKETTVRLTVNSGVRIGDVKLGLGPEISLFVNYEEDLSSMEEITGTEPKYNAGFNFLAGFILNDHLHIDLRYTYIFQDVSGEYAFQNIPMDMRTNQKYLELALAAYF